MLKGRKFLITRNRIAALNLQQSLADKGYDSIISPICNLFFLRDRVSEVNLDKYDVIVITSYNAFLTLNEQQRNILSQKKILSVAKRVKGDDVSYFDSAAGLYKNLESFEKGRVLILSGNYSVVGRENFNLEHLDITDIECYRMEYLDEMADYAVELFKEEDVTDLVFLSANNLRCFIEALKRDNALSLLQKTNIFVMSARIAKELDTIKVANLYIAKESSLKGVLDIV